MNEYVCMKCGHLVLAKDKPDPMEWSDGHVCIFVQVTQEKPK